MLSVPNARKGEGLSKYQRIFLIHRENVMVSNPVNFTLSSIVKITLTQSDQRGTGVQELNGPPIFVPGLKLLDKLRTVPTNSEVFLPGG